MLGKKSLVAEYYDEMVGEHVVGMFCGEFVYDRCRLHPRLLMPKHLKKENIQLNDTMSQSMWKIMTGRNMCWSGKKK